MPQEAGDTWAPGGIPGGLDNRLGGAAVAHAEHRPHSRGRLEVVGRTQVEVDNKDMASIPLVACTGPQWLARPQVEHCRPDLMGPPTDLRH